MTNSEEISAKEALEMIIRGQIGELLFRRVKVEPEKVREEPVFEAAPNMTVSVTTGPVTIDTEDGEPMVIENATIINCGHPIRVSKNDRISIELENGRPKMVDGKVAVKVTPQSLRDKVDDRVSSTVMGGLQMADPKDWFFALIDVLDEERAQSGQSRPVGKDRWIE